MPGPLKLRAEAVEDVTVFGSYLQDAALTVADVAWLPAQRRFALVCNRFMWEHADQAGHFRTRTGLHFDTIIAVKFRNIPMAAKTQVLELLTLHATVDDKRALITLAFAGGGDIRLEAEIIDGAMEDMGVPWKTKNQPKHAD